MTVSTTPREDVAPSSASWATEPATGGASTAERRRLEALLGLPFTDGNAVDVLRNGDEMFPALLDAIGAATASIDMLWFLWGRGDITQVMTDALAARARDGVQVRMLLDGFGARGMSHDQVRQLRDAGCQVVFYRPFRGHRVTALNMRTHRRVLVCDGTVGFTGGTGIDVAWTGHAQSPAHWRDTGYRLRGPAVDGLRSAFALDWLQTACPLVTEQDRFAEHARSGSARVQVVSATSQPGWNASGLAVLTALDLAQHRLRIATPYARLPERLHAALAAAVDRGVQVQLLVSGPHVDRKFVAAQSRHHYARLLDAGVELWSYQPTLLHAKVMTVDGWLSVVGTTNLDIRSIALNEQLNLLVDDAHVTSVLDGHFDDDLADSEQLQARQWRDRGRGQRFTQGAASVLGGPLQGLGTRGQAGRWP